jgi:hypothetical protein
VQGLRHGLLDCQQHGRTPSQCKDCGTGYCEQNRRKGTCKDCGTGYCEHNRRKNCCRDCGTGYCELRAQAPAEGHVQGMLNGAQLCCEHGRTGGTGARAAAVRGPPPRTLKAKMIRGASRCHGTITQPPAPPPRCPAPGPPPPRGAPAPLNTNDN